jgi:hypothetical protein
MLTESDRLKAEITDPMNQCSLFCLPQFQPCMSMLERRWLTMPSKRRQQGQLMKTDIAGAGHDGQGRPNALMVSRGTLNVAQFLAHGQVQRTNANPCPTQDGSTTVAGRGLGQPGHFRLVAPWPYLCETT